mgnify:CR=1 FL=1
MSFYPGETYAHEVKENIDFYVQTRLKMGKLSLGSGKNWKMGKKALAQLLMQLVLKQKIAQ